MARVLPVIALDQSADAVPLAKTLLEAGVAAMELQGCNSQTWQALSALRRTLPSMIVGVQGVGDPLELRAALEAGAAYVSGLARLDRAYDASAGRGLRFLPTVGTIAEVQSAMEAGYRCCHLPVRRRGALRLLRSLLQLTPQVRFHLTIDNSSENVAALLAAPNVVSAACEGLVPTPSIGAGRWSEIYANVELACAKADEAWRHPH